MPSRTLAFSPCRSVSAVDTEIAGAVMRVVLDGAPKLFAKTPSEALQELRAKHDDFRRFLVGPPRGHRYLNACILLPPFSFDAHRTAIVAEDFGYAPVAGTALLAAAAALVETEEVAAVTPHTTIFFDTSHGLVSVVATVSDGHCTSARWFTEAPRIVAGDLRIDIRGRPIQAMVVSTDLPYVVARHIDLGVRLDDPPGLPAKPASGRSDAGGQR